jgi:trans-aconitate methyltransferase
MGEWNPALYESRHSFVWERGRELVEMLAPRAGERILDVGCGTGQLTGELAAWGAEVVGIDNSRAMIEQARANFPRLRFEEADVRELAFREEFDGVFSNAALHWVREADGAAAAMSAALKGGGRMAVEFGGRGNTRALVRAAAAALEALGVEPVEPWYYPGVAEYAAVLERHGLEVQYAALFERPIALEGGAGGLASWLEMFGRPFLAALEPGRGAEFVRLVEEQARPALFRDGNWTMDYRRLRVMAVKRRYTGEFE